MGVSNVTSNNRFFSPSWSTQIQRLSELNTKCNIYFSQVTSLTEPLSLRPTDQNTYTLVLWVCTHLLLPAALTLSPRWEEPWTSITLHTRLMYCSTVHENWIPCKIQKPLSSRTHTRTYQALRKQQYKNSGAPHPVCVRIPGYTILSTTSQPVPHLVWGSLHANLCSDCLILTLSHYTDLSRPLSYQAL